MHVNEQIFGDGGNISLAHGAPTPLSAVFLLSVCKGTMEVISSFKASKRRSITFEEFTV